MSLLGRKKGIFGGGSSRDTRPVTIPFPCVQVRFDIDSLSGSMMYGDECCELLLDAISPEKLNGMVLYYGDSDKTLANLENVFVITIACRDKNYLRNTILPSLQENSTLLDHCSEPEIELLDSSREPLIMLGVVINGMLEDQESFMATALRHRAEKQ